MRSVRPYRRTFGELTVYWAAPRTVREVLEWEVEVLAFAERGEDVDTVLAAVRWLERYVEVNGRPLTIEDCKDFGTRLVEIGNAVAASAGYRPEEFEPIRRTLQISHGADEYREDRAQTPCECPACRGDEEPDESCKWFGVPVTSRLVVGRLALAAANPVWLDAPVWLYQIASESARAESEGYAARRQQADAERTEREDQETRTKRAAEMQVERFGRVMWGRR